MSVRKILFIVLSIVICLGALPLAAQDDPINMTMWVRSIPFQTQAMVDEWNANNDSQIELTVIPSGEFVTKMGAAIAAGEPPDIASIDLIYTPAFAAAGQLVDITEWVRQLPYADDLTPAHMELGMYEGRNYAVPTGVDGSFIVYNIDLFEQAGLDPEDPPQHLGRDAGSGARYQRARRRHLRLLVLNGLRRLQRFHVPAFHLGQRRRCAQRRLL